MLRPVFINKDIERYTILKKCNDLIFSDPDMVSEFDDHLLQRAYKYFDIFDKIRAYEEYIEKEQKQQNDQFLNLFNKASIFVKHYFQTMQMAIQRGEIPQNTVNYYELSYPFEIPEFKSDVQLLNVAEKLFKDDYKRTSEGGKYFTNPSIGSVKVWVEKFAEAVRVKNNTYNVKQAEIENIEGIRTDTDKLLTDVFDIVLSKIESEPQKEKKKILKACGFDLINIEDYNSDYENKKQSDINDRPDQLKFDL